MEPKKKFSRNDVRRVKGLAVATNLKAGDSTQQQRFKIQQDTQTKIFEAPQG